MRRPLSPEGQDVLAKACVIGTQAAAESLAEVRMDQARAASDQLRMALEAEHRHVLRLKDACLDAFNIIDGCPCPIDDPDEWRMIVRKKLIEALGR
jgi:hypothetical protein